MPSSELYIGNLDPDTRSQELRDVFDRYGSINRCEVKFGGSTYSAAFGFIGFDSKEDAERAQRKEHGRSLRGRRLIVEFTKTTPGQNGRRGRYVGGDYRMGNGSRRDRSRSNEKDDSRAGYRRRRSNSYNRRSSRDRSQSSDRHRDRDRSRSPYQYESNSRRNRSPSNQESNSNSYSNKNGNNKKR